LNRRQLRLEGCRDVALILPGVVPFGMIAGAAALVTWRTGNMLATLLVGMAVLWLLVLVI
jgi:hypothetical protein